MNKHPDSRKALGKGLGALIPMRSAPVAEVIPAAAEPPGSGLSAVAIDFIDANPLQPRRIFHPERLEELAQSIRANGIIQPLVLRRKGARYQLVAGERRWRAAKLAGVSEVPAVIQEIPDERLLEVTLIENIQREDLNPIETAQAFERLAREANLSHEEIGRRTGKDRTTITNLLRLLHLPADIQQLISERRLSAGHARCLLSLPDPDTQRGLAEKAVSQAWSVRQMERVTQRMLESRVPKKVDEVDVDPNVKAAIAELERVLGTRVRILEKSRDKGRIEIEYYSTDDLNRIYEAIVGPSAS